MFTDPRERRALAERIATRLVLRLRAQRPAYRAAMRILHGPPLVLRKPVRSDAALRALHVYPPVTNKEPK
jgi:hypothetical protein